MSARLPWILALMALTVAACDSVPFTERKQLIVISESKEQAMGAQAARQIMRTERPLDDPAARELVTRVGRRIAQASGRTDLAWEFHVIDNDQVTNAFCLPGGKIFVYSGLLRRVGSEDELATVMAHEVAHALARHGAERASLEMAARLGGAILQLALGDEDPRLADIAGRVWGFGSNLGLMLPYSRKHEYEADTIGLSLMDKAGYNLDGAVTFWEMMRQSGNSKPLFNFLSTHPTDEKRIARIRKDIETIRQGKNRGTS
ncbi:M48 family metallopeptidase [Solidesulfovibrio sp.]